MAIRRVPHQQSLKIHVKAMEPEERKKVRHIHIDNITPGVQEGLNGLSHLMLVTYEPGIVQDRAVVEEIRKKGISVVPLATPKPPKKKVNRIPDWYTELIE